MVFFFLVESGAIQFQKMGGKFGAHPKSLWGAAALDTSHSWQCQADETSSPLLQILCHQSWRGQPVPAAPAEPGQHHQDPLSPGVSSLISSLVSFSSCHHQKPFIHGRCHKGKSICVVTFSQVFNFNPLWGAVAQVQAHRLLIYLQLRLSESGC